MSHGKEFSLRQQLFFEFLACFFAGILTANFLGADIFQENGNLTRYYLKQLQYADIVAQELFWHVCANRLPLFVALLLLGGIPRGRLVHAVFVAWSGFAYGYFCVMTICGYGARGLILCALWRFFHSFFCIFRYTLVWWSLSATVTENEEDFVFCWSHCFSCAVSLRECYWNLTQIL